MKHKKPLITTSAHTQQQGFFVTGIALLVLIVGGLGAAAFTTNPDVVGPGKSDTLKSHQESTQTTQMTSNAGVEKTSIVAK